MNNYAHRIFSNNTLIINHIHLIIPLFCILKPPKSPHFSKNILKCVFSVFIIGLNPIFCIYSFNFFLVKYLYSL